MAKNAKGGEPQNAENQEINIPQTVSSGVVNENFNVDFDKLDKAKEKHSLNLEYLKLEEGEVVRGVFMGAQKQVINEEEKEVMAIYTKEGAKMTASFIICQALRNKEVGTLIQITYTGIKKMGAKQLGMYEVHELSID